MIGKIKARHRAKSHFLAALVSTLCLLIPLMAFCEERFGMSAMKRKAVFEELIRAEDLSEEKYPSGTGVNLNQAVTLQRDMAVRPELNAGKREMIPKGTKLRALKKATGPGKIVWYFVEGVQTRYEGWAISISLNEAATEWKTQLARTAQLREDFKNKLESNVGRKYGLTRQQVKEIIAEGITRDWPMPPSL